MKTYQFHFEGVVEIEAENEDVALEKALGTLEKADIGFWEVTETNPDHADLTTF